MKNQKEMCMTKGLQTLFYSFLAIFSLCTEMLTASSKPKVTRDPAAILRRRAAQDQGKGAAQQPKAATPAAKMPIATGEQKAMIASENAPQSPEELAIQKKVDEYYIALQKVIETASITPADKQSIYQAIQKFVDTLTGGFEKIEQMVKNQPEIKKAVEELLVSIQQEKTVDQLLAESIALLHILSDKPLPSVAELGGDQSFYEKVQKSYAEGQNFLSKFALSASEKETLEKVFNELKTSFTSAKNLITAISAKLQKNSTQALNQLLELINKTTSLTDFMALVTGFYLVVVPEQKPSVDKK